MLTNENAAAQNLAHMLDRLKEMSGRIQNPDKMLDKTCMRCQLECSVFDKWLQSY